MRGFKKLLIKCFDSNENGKLEWGEIIYPLTALFIFELLSGIIANFLYDIIKGAR
jgi:hypothetical protein